MKAPAIRHPDMFVSLFKSSGVKAFAFDYDETITAGKNNVRDLLPAYPAEDKWNVLDVISDDFEKVAHLLKRQDLPLFVISDRVEEEAYVRYVLKVNQIEPATVFIAHPE